MAQAQKPAETPAKAEVTPAKAEAIPAKQEHASPVEGKAAEPVAASSPKDKLMTDHPETPNSRSAPDSPMTPPQTTKDVQRQISPGERGTNMKAEAFAVAHSKRVDTEAHAYIDAEVRKAEAHAEKEQAMADKTRMREEAKAKEKLKLEEQRAEKVVHQAELKADKLVATAKEKAVAIKATAKEESEKHIAEANTHAEKTQAQIEEAKNKEVAELDEKVEQMKITGEVPGQPKKGLGSKIKQKLAGQH